MRIRPARRRAGWSAVATTAGLLGLGVAMTADARRPRASQPSMRRDTVPAAATIPIVAGPTRVAMRNVDFYVDPEVVLHIHGLHGTMRSIRGGPIVFDDKRSFVIQIDTAEVGLTGADLGALMNKYVFAYRGAPITNVRITLRGTQLVQRGVLHKGVALPFEITATPDVMPDGRIRLHPTRTRILGVNGEKLMKALGLSLEKMIDLRRARGATVHGNDIYLDPVKLLPPPAIAGRVVAVRVRGNEMVQTFGTAGGGRAPLPPLAVPDSAAPAYMFYRGGTLRFGKLLMLDAEMQIVHLDSAGPFKFDLDRYERQLVAGYSRTLPSQGLEVYMRDIDKVGGRPPVVPVAAPASGEP